MKKIVIALFIMSITCFAILKGSLWYFTQQFVDNQVIQAKSYAQITYKEIKSSFTGSATVSGIKVYIPLLDESIFIESIQFMAPDLITLLTLDNQLKNNELPESLKLIITGAALDLNGNLMKMIDNPDIPPTQLEVFSTLACGDIHRIGSKALNAMGYDSFTSDIVLSYNYDARKKTLVYHLKDSIRDITHLNFSGKLKNVTDLNSFKNNNVKSGPITLEIIDDSYIERKNRFCANQGGRKTNEYIKEHTLQVEEYLLSYGVEPEEGLLSAYKTVLETSGAIRLEADLSNLTGTQELVSFEPNDIIQFVRLKLFVNNKRINEISINIDKEKLVQTATNTEVELETPDEVKKKQAIIIKKYRPVSIANLKNFNGFRVKIKTDKGKQFKGTLKVSNPKIYEIVSRLRSGNISYHVPVKTITKAEVFN
ncbi:MAG: hypothetical protein OQL19_16165 [Gammaproteobacteria bacterium]|nr:hypothetical protein [Gammaproteobacteria bacterium]